MSPSLTLSSGFAAALFCYLTGCALGYLLRGRTPPFSRLNREDFSERQLRVEVRDLISKIILDALERDEVPALSRVLQQCPDHLRSGKSWDIWTGESPKMLKSMLPEDS